MRRIAIYLGLVVAGIAYANSSSVLPEFSFAGYQRGERPLPTKRPDVSVADFGAVGDAKTDCTEAFQRAIQTSPGKVIAVPEGTFLLSDRLQISEPGTVLTGAGRSKTILAFSRGLQEIEPTQAETGSGFATNQWSWSGGIITLGRDLRTARKATILNAAAQGSSTLKLNVAKQLAPGDSCLLRLMDSGDYSLIDYVYAGRPGDISLLKKRGFSISQAVTIAAVEGTTVQIDQPLRFDLRAEWKPILIPITNSSQEVGISDLTIRFPQREYRGHWREDGMNGFAIAGANNWARNIRIQNCDSGVFVYGVWNTVQGLTIESERKAHRSGKTGHHGILVSGKECLVSDFKIGTRFYHDLTVSGGSVGNVFSQGSAVDMSIDHHRYAPYQNLFTEIHVGVGSRVWQSGGTRGKGLHTATGATFWNINSERPFKLPREDFGPPGLVFVGLNTLPAQTDLPGGWHYQDTPPADLQPQNLYRTQLQNRLSFRSAFDDLSGWSDDSSTGSPKSYRLSDGSLRISTRARSKDRVKICSKARFGAGRYSWRVFVPAMGKGDQASIGAFLYHDDSRELDFEIGYGKAELREQLSAGEDDLVCFCSSQGYPRSSSQLLLKANSWHDLAIDIAYGSDGQYHVRWLVDGKQVKQLQTGFGPEVSFTAHCSVENLKFIGDHPPKQENYALFDAFEFVSAKQED
jgi:hypothetical protein